MGEILIVVKTGDFFLSASNPIATSDQRDLEENAQRGFALRYVDH